MDDMQFEFSMEDMNERARRERTAEVRVILREMQQERVRLNDLSQAYRNRHEKIVHRIQREVRNWFKFAELFEINEDTEYYKDIMQRYTAIGVNERRRFSLENDTHRETIDAFLLRVRPLFEEYSWNRVENVNGSASENRETFASEPSDDVGGVTDEQNEIWSREIGDIGDTSGW